MVAVGLESKENMMNTMDIESNVFAEGNDPHPGMTYKLRHVYTYNDKATGIWYRWAGLHMDMPGDIQVFTPRPGKAASNVTVHTSDAVLTRHILTLTEWHFRRLLRDLLGINAPKGEIEYDLFPTDDNYNDGPVPVAGMEWVDQDTEGICFDLNCDLREYNAMITANLVAEIAEQRIEPETCDNCTCGMNCQYDIISSVATPWLHPDNDVYFQRELEGKHHVEINRLVDERHEQQRKAGWLQNDTVTSVIVVLSLAAFPIALRIAEMLAKA
jgi:hypothetical protein